MSEKGYKEKGERERAKEKKRKNEKKTEKMLPAPTTRVDPNPEPIHSRHRLRRSLHSYIEATAEYARKMPTADRNTKNDNMLARLLDIKPQNPLSN